MPAPTTPLYRLVETLLEQKDLGPLREYVLTRRLAGASWRTISQSIRFDTGEDVTEQTITTWFAEDPEITQPTVTT